MAKVKPPRESEFTLVSPNSVFPFESILARAVKLFNDQTLASDSDDISLKDIELTKAKANSFLAGISNIIEANHQLDIILSTDKGFKRRDELDILNNLREQCDAQARIGQKMMNILNKRLTRLLDSLEDGEAFDREELAHLHNLLDHAVDTTNKVITSTSKLIQLERNSGGRSWGRGSAGLPNAGVLNLEPPRGEDDTDLGGAAPKKVTSQELANAQSYGKSTSSQRYK